MSKFLWGEFSSRNDPWVRDNRGFKNVISESFLLRQSGRNDTSICLLCSKQFTVAEGPYIHEIPGNLYSVQVELAQ